jgi:hypothetical protein
MQKAAGHILKSSEVKLEGQIRLDPRFRGDRLAPAQAGVRIVESHPEFAVIEVVCCCGARTYLKCQYAGGAEGSGQSTSGQVSEQPSV